MKRITMLFSLVLLAATLPLQAVAADTFKIGYVNAQRLLDEAPQAEAESVKLKEEFSGREEKLVARQKELKELQDKLSRDGAIMSESERQKLGMDVLNRQRELRRDQQAFGEDLNLRRNEVLGKLQQQIQESIEKIGKEQDFDLILYEGIAYASGKLDLTEQVLAELEKAHKQ